MKNTEISSLAEDVSEMVPNDNKSAPKNGSGLIKLVLIAFILLLSYLILNNILLKKGNSTQDSLNVIGIYYGPVDVNSNDEISIKLGNSKELQNGIVNTKTSDNKIPIDSEVKPEVKPAPSKKEILSKIPLGTDFSQVVKQIGQPTKTLNITDQKKDSGFKMYLWQDSSRIVCVFYKNKLLSKL